jgi:hypothetical protein
MVYIIDITKLDLNAKKNEKASKEEVKSLTEILANKLDKQPLHLDLLLEIHMNHCCLM